MHRLEAAKAHALARPYVLKPVSEGSSFGVFIVKEDQEHPPQELTRADWVHGEMMLAEQFIAGRELTCAVMGDRPLDVIEIVRRAAVGTIMRRNTQKAGRNTYFLQFLNRIFTKKFKSWRSRLTELSDAAA